MGQIPAHISLPVSLVVSGLLLIQKWHHDKRAAHAQEQAQPVEKFLDQVDQQAVAAELVRGETEVEESGELSPATFTQPTPLPVLLLDESYPLGVNRMWRLLMDERSRFVARMHSLRRNRDVSIGKWVEEGGVWTRNVMFTTPLKKNPLGPREAECQETYTATRLDGGFIVDVICKTPKVPYGGSFFQRLQWFVWREAAGRTHLRISAQVEFTQNVLVRGLISRASVDGMKETYGMYRDALRQFVEEMQRARLQSTPRDVEVAIGSEALAETLDQQQQQQQQQQAQEQGLQSVSNVLLWVSVGLLWCLVCYMAWVQTQQQGLLHERMQALEGKLNELNAIVMSSMPRTLKVRL